MRLAPEFQYAFLKLMSEEFTTDWQEGKFDKVRWRDERHKKELREIIAEPAEFFQQTRSVDYIDERVQIVGTVNRKIYMKGILQEIRQSDVTIIYGAGIRGQWVLERLLEKGVPKSKFMFAISHKDMEDDEVMEIPVIEINRLDSVKKKLFVIVAVKGEAQIEMLGNLQRKEIENVALADEEFLKLLQIPCEK